MGKAKTRKDRAKEVEGMSLPQQVQHYASKIVKEARPLIDFGIVRWMNMTTDDGLRFICLVFPASSWQLIDGELRLKNEPNKTITTSEASKGDRHQGIVGNIVR